MTARDDLRRANLARLLIHECHFWRAWRPSLMQVITALLLLAACWLLGQVGGLILGDLIARGTL